MRADADDSQIYAYFAAERGKQGRLRQVRIELRTASGKTGNSINCKSKYNVDDVRAGFHAGMGGARL